MTDMNNKDNNIPGNDVDNLIRQREFGDRFRVAREAAGMSTAEVAEELRLAEDIIKALENSQLDSLPAPTFTQGYIRSYAKILKLPVDEILKAYDRLIPEKEAPLTVRTSVSAQKDSSDIGVKLITFGLLVAALILFVFWFQQTDFDFINGDTDLNNIGTEQDPPQQMIISSEIEAESSMQTPDSVNTAASDLDSRHNITSEQATAVLADAESEPEPVDTLPEPSNIDENTTPVSALQAPDSEPAQIGKPELEPDLPVVKKKSIITQPVIGNDVLVMATDDESWAEVEDANGARLYFDLMKQDSEYKLRGQAPFMLFLGNAPSVTLGVNNQVLNISEYVRRNNIAHIKISKDGAISPIRTRIMVPATSDEQIIKPDSEAAETGENLQPALDDEQ